MADIDIGIIPTDVGNWAPTYTTINADNPANATGKITAVTLKLNEETTGIIVATFQKVNGTTFTARDSYAVGTLAAGIHTGVVVDIDVTEGDYIGHYGTAGAIRTATAGYSGKWYLDGDQTECVDAEFATLAGALYLYGEGELLGWSGKVMGVTDPAKVMGVDKANIAKVSGVS